MAQQRRTRKAKTKAQPSVLPSVLKQLAAVGGMGLGAYLISTSRGRSTQQARQDALGAARNAAAVQSEALGKWMGMVAGVMPAINWTSAPDHSPNPEPGSAPKTIEADFEVIE